MGSPTLALGCADLVSLVCRIRSYLIAIMLGREVPFALPAPFSHRLPEM